ncbi:MULTISPECIES: HipA domain-containing protein [Vibrio]|uniref:HipA domain-containing protein n=1 Tax=Vibrio TaxID=662 RepID=UPI00352CC75E
MQYPVYEVPDEAFDDYEDMGTKSKFWYTESDSEEQFLFKSTHTEDKKGNKIVRTGEDWAEKVACELAELLDMPHASYDLASHNGETGTRSKNFSKEGDTLTFGNSLLEKLAQTHNLDPKEGQKTQELSRVYMVLKKIIQYPPLGWSKTQNIKTASDVFLGYLMLDCLISNQDRHNENWAMMTHIDGTKSLAPTFDHAASLGRNESDDKRSHKLTSKDKNQSVEHYVQKCKSHFYYKGTKLKTIDAFKRLSQLSIPTAFEWIDRLDAITEESINHILTSVPQHVMSDIAKEFCATMILINKERIIELKGYLLRVQEKNNS